METQQQNSREFSRVNIKIEAIIDIDDQKHHIENTRDVSMKGIFLMSDLRPQQGSLCSITLLLKGIEPPIEINLKGKVQRITEDGLGILFKEIDLESYGHLNNLVMQNSDDADKAAQEIKNHIGIKQR